MCLCCREDESVQVNPESSSWRHPAEVTQRQSTAKRIEHMRNLWKQKRKFNKRFARPAPVPEPGLLEEKRAKLAEAAERRQKEAASRGILNVQSVEEKRKKKEKIEKEMATSGPPPEGGLRWTVS
uniref:Uncharacterized protein n=1 Tax=Ovis aries TaxID=9940 RepID=A0AC11DJR3_SHEEP